MRVCVRIRCVRMGIGNGLVWNMFNALQKLGGSLSTQCNHVIPVVGREYWVLTHVHIEWSKMP